MDDSLRRSLETWEQETAAYWDSLIRSPDFLRRISRQITASLLAQQRMAASLQTAAQHMAGLSPTSLRETYLLERLEQQLNHLAARIAALEQALDDG